MKTILVAVLFSIGINGFCQVPAQNLFIITTDGFRWQEVFNGADSDLINDPQYVKDTFLIKQLFWDNNAETRRQKLMPFFWTVLSVQGQLFGNRQLNSKVNVKNIYKISYPGYDEILNGYADIYPKLNVPYFNNNESFLEYFNNQAEFNGKVVAFTSWNAFPYIINRKRSKLFINSGYEHLINDSSGYPSAINNVEDGIINKGHTRYDLLTFLSAKEYVNANHPRIVFISFGETDEMAHQNKYDEYLKAANNVDHMISELWYYVQTDPFYKNNTTFILTTDHGRGAKASTWHTHNLFTKGSGDIWLAFLGNGIAPAGEIYSGPAVFQKQIAATAALLIGRKYSPLHPVAKPIKLPGFLSASIHSSPSSISTSSVNLLK